jgi:hypothetical protein
LFSAARQGRWHRPIKLLLSTEGDKKMKRTIVSILLSMALAMGTLTACGGDACEEAADKLEDCGFDNMGTGSGDGECSGEAECVANCIIDASCSEILDFLNPDTDYAQCVLGCE